MGGKGVVQVVVPCAANARVAQPSQKWQGVKDHVSFANRTSKSCSNITSFGHSSKNHKQAR